MSDFSLKQTVRPVFRVAAGLTVLLVAGPAAAQFGDIPCESGQATACQIRMTGSTGPQSTVIYTYAQDYTEYLTGEGQRVYLSPDRGVAMYSPERGWIDIPPSAQAMVLGQMQSMPGLPGMADNFGEEGDFTARMPRILVERFSLERMRERVRDADSGNISRNVSCPGGHGTGCVRVDPPQSSGGSLVYDSAERLLIMNEGAAQHEVRFEYGEFEVGTPPGW